MENTPQIEVYYDGDCPICRWEVALYGRMDKSGHIRWTDIISLPDTALPPDKTRQDLLGKFHARERAAQPPIWHMGVDAFARIWRVLPGLRYFAWLFSVPGLRQIMGLAYRCFLRWQSWHRTHRR